MSTGVFLVRNKCPFLLKLCPGVFIAEDFDEEIFKDYIQQAKFCHGVQLQNTPRWTYCRFNVRCTSRSMLTMLDSFSEQNGRG